MSVETGNFQGQDTSLLLEELVNRHGFSGVLFKLGKLLETL